MDGIKNADAEGLGWVEEITSATSTFHPDNPVHPVKRLFALLKSTPEIESGEFSSSSPSKALALLRALRAFA